MKKIIFLTLLVLLIAVQVRADHTTLHTTATGLSPGSWSSALTTSGFNNGDVLRSGTGGVCGSILEYLNIGMWNQINNTIMILGGAHPNSGACITPPMNIGAFAKYTDSSNTWMNTLPNPSPTFDNGYAEGLPHNYNQNTIVTSTGDVYHRQYDSTRVMKFSHAAQNWSMCTAIPANTNVAEALVYFPDRNSLFYLDGDWGVYELSLASGNCLGSWTQRAAGVQGGFSPQLVGVQSYHVEAVYSSKCACIVFGGGNDGGGNRSRTLWRIYSNLTMTVAASPPGGIDFIGIPDGASGFGTALTADPASGNILVWNHQNYSTTMFEYDPTANSWSTISRTSPIVNFYQGIAIPISSYGVIMWVEAGSAANGQVRVYKHASGGGGGDVTAPTAPSSLVATATSSSQINLTWTASTDAVGVTGYGIYRCQGAACSPIAQINGSATNSFSDTGLTASTAYTYAVDAHDAANNTSAKSGSATATTQAGGGGGSDFATRCAKAGVVLCNGFDQISDLGTIGGAAYGTWRGVFNTYLFTHSTCNTTIDDHCPTIDTTQKSSGAGSMKFTVGAGEQGGQAGQFFTNFSSNYSIRFGAGDTFYWSFRVRFDNNYVAAAHNGTTGMKLGMVSTGNDGVNIYGSCTDLEIVPQHTYARGYLLLYNSCAGGPVEYVHFEEPFGGSDYKEQNGRPFPYCLYQQGAEHGGKGYFPPNGNCWETPANEWITLKLQVVIGARQQVGPNYFNFVNSAVRLWVAHDGQGWESLIDFPNVNLEATSANVAEGGANDFQKYGAVWFLPYSGAATYPNGGVAWYDELIISTTDIDAPGTSGPGTPTGIRVSGRRNN